MSFFSWVKDCATSIASGIKSCVKGICSSLATAASSIGTAVKDCIPILGKWAGNIGFAVQCIGIAIDVVSKICGLLRQDEKVTDIGERALQAEDYGITLDSCNKDFKTYMKKLREFTLDPQKAAARTETEQWLAGSLVLEKGIEQLFPQMSTRDMWPILARASGFFTKQRLDVYAQLAKERNLPFGEALATFFMPPDNGHVSKNVRDYVWDAEKRFNPSATPNQLHDEFKTVREECAAPDPSQK